MRTCSLFFLALLGCSAHAQNSNTAPPPVPVHTALVSHEKLTQTIHAAGVLAAKRELTLAFKTGGVVASIFVDEGASVHKGQLLAQLNLTEIDAQVHQAEQAFAKAERDLERVRRLRENEALPLSDLQNATTAYEVAKSTLQAARFNQQYSSIVAPEDGRVQKRFVEAGEVVGPGMPALRVSTVGNGFVVRVGLPDRELVRLQLGDVAEVAVDTEAQPLPALVSEIGAIASPRTGTYEVELHIGTPPKTLLSGLVAKVAIHPIARQMLSVVPIEALLDGDGDLGAVFALNGTSPKRTPVRVAFIEGSMVAIASGLEQVDTVITDGAAYVHDDSPVVIRAAR